MVHHPESLPRRPQLNHKIPYKRTLTRWPKSEKVEAMTAQRKALEDTTLLALMTEDGALSQGMQTAFRR